jgi:uncharacterized protein
MIIQDAAYWINKLRLQTHPEGGFYRESYRATGNIAHEALPAEFKGDRQFATAIYFLLRSQDRSMFHRIKSDELWHYHAGGSLSIYMLDNTGLQIQKLGSNLEQGESLQVVVPAGKWFGALVNNPDDYTLAGCTVAPGFDFSDFELASRKQLLHEFPLHREIILKLTR